VIASLLELFCASKLTPVAADEFIETCLHVEPANKSVHPGEFWAGTHTATVFRLILINMRFNQMIDVADTITTCAELEDNVTLMGDSKVLQEAMNAMQQDGDSVMEVLYSPPSPFSRCSRGVLSSSFGVITHT
jgi:hypothetical protein